MLEKTHKTKENSATNW